MHMVYCLSLNSLCGTLDTITTHVKCSSSKCKLAQLGLAFYCSHKRQKFEIHVSACITPRFIIIMHARQSAKTFHICELASDYEDLCYTPRSREKWKETYVQLRLYRAGGRSLPNPVGRIACGHSRDKNQKVYRRQDGS